MVSVKAKGRTSLLVLLLKAIEALVGAAFSILLARLLGAKEFGSFAFGLALITITAIPFKIGLATMITKDVSLAVTDSDSAHAGSAFRIGLQVSIAYSFFVIFAAFLAYYFFGEGVDLPASAFLFSLALPFLCLIGLIEGVLRGAYRPVSSVVVGTVLLPLLLLLFAILSPHSVEALGWAGMAVAYVTSSLLVLLVATFLSFKQLMKLLEKWRSREVLLSAWFAAAVPFMLVSGLLIFNRQIDLVLIGLMASETEAGIYRVAAQAAILVTFGVQAIGQVYAPYLAVRDEDRDCQKVAAYLAKSVRFSLLLGVLCTVGLALFGESLLVLLAGEEYRAGFWPMIVLCAANLSVAANGSIVQALSMQGYQDRVAWVFGVSAFLSVVLNVILINAYGVNGAAVATSIAIVFWSFLLRLYASRAWGLSFFRLRCLD